MNKNDFVAVGCSFFFLFFAGPCFADALENGDIGEKIRQPVRESVEIRKQTQETNEQWQRERQALAARYDRLREENRRLAAREAALEEKVSASERRIKRKEKQLADIEHVTLGIEPFLMEMKGRIEALTTDGLPFLQKERQQRMEGLHEMLADPDVPVSEKYRKVMEALLVEAEYGNTIEVYQKTIAADGKILLANIFRLGRISLFYQTMDRQESGWFNTAEGRWEKLSKTYNRDISTAIDIGAKRQPAELLTLPLGRLVVQ